MTTTVPKNMTTETEVLGGANVGTGEAGVFKDKSGENLRFRTLKAGANITITQNADDITITAAGGGGALPGGGSTANVLRGDGTWSDTILGPLTINGTVFGFPGSSVRANNSGGAFPAYAGVSFLRLSNDTSQPGMRINWQGGSDAGGFDNELRASHNYTSEVFSLVFDGTGSASTRRVHLKSQLEVDGNLSCAGTVSAPLLTGLFNGTAAASVITSGQFAAARLAAGTASEGFVPKVVSGVVTWAADATGGGGISDGNKGDITVSASGSSWQINASAVSTNEIADQGVTPAKLNRATGPAPSSAGYYRGNGEWRNFFTDSNTWSNANRFLTTGTNVSSDLNITAASNSSATATLTRTCRPANDRSGAAYLVTTRDGGSPQNNFFIEYNVTTPLGSGFDIALTALATYTNLTGGAATGAWLCAFSPSQALGQTWSSGSVFAAEINYGNRWGNIGLCEDRLQPRWVAGLQVVPDVVLTFDGANPNTQFDAQFGIVFAASGVGAKTHIPLFIEENATAVNGYAMKIVGGSNSANKAAFLLKAGGHFNQGIDFSGVTFADTEKRAILLAGGQAIEFGGGRIWYDVATQKMKVYDPIGGTRDL